MRGCTQCAQRTIRRYKGEDEDLLNEYQEHHKDYLQYQEEQRNKSKHRKRS